MIRFAAAPSAEELSNLRESIQNVSLRTGLVALGMLLVSILAIRLVIVLVDRMLRRTKLDSSLHRFIETMLRVLLYFAALLMIASYVGIDVTSLVALLSLVSLAITLSVQNALSNVAGGIMIMGTKPFRKGDYVSVDELAGVVDEIGMFYTKLHTIDNRSVLIPNSKVAAATVENYSAFGKRRLDMEFSASYEAEPERVRQALRAAVERCDPLEGEELCVAIQSFDDSAIRYHVHFWIPANRVIQTRFDLNSAVWEEFRRGGIEMTYPHMNVHIQNRG